MAGGLIQVVAYGSQDLFLTGTPEITFFKIVYRRYTNFSMETTVIPFTSDVGFGETAKITIPKTADLLYKTYLQITLPSVKCIRPLVQNDINAATINYNTAIQNYQIVLDYMQMNTELYRQAYIVSLAINSTIQNIIDAMNTISQNTIIITNFFNLIQSINTSNAGIDINNIQNLSMLNVANNNINNTVSNLITSLNFCLYQCTKITKYFNNIINDTLNILNDTKNIYRKFAWTKRIGHAIIDYVEITIGGTTIDKHYGIWLNIWYELTGNHNSSDTYDKMIGDIDILTSYDRSIKPSYTLYIPLQFWFCKTSGSALPLIALQYHDIEIYVRLKSAQDIAQLELIGNESQLYIDDMFSDLAIGLDMSLIADYIYLDSGERKKIAQGSHEYLIEQVQYISYDNLTNNTIFQAQLDFFHPCKEIIWILQKDSYIKNISGDQPCFWTNYSTNIDPKLNLNPVKQARLSLNGTNLFDFDGKYFTNVQPYSHHTNIPLSCINCYCFSEKPEEHQPSGSCNFSRLSKVFLDLYLNSDLFTDIRNQNYIQFNQTFNGLYYTDSFSFDNMSSSIDDYYVGWTISIDNYVYTIIEYNGASHIAFINNYIQISVSNQTIYSVSSSPTITNTTTATLHIFATNNNVLRFISGIGGLAFI